MKIMGILSLMCLGLAFATLGSDISTWASNAAIVLAIHYTYNPPSKET